jgi:tetratricopeptide (TPR) repeat protein
MNLLLRIVTFNVVMIPVFLRRLLLLSFFLSFMFAVDGQTKSPYDILADSLISRGQSDQLTNYFEKELKSKPGNEDLLRWLGYLAIQGNNPAVGEKYYQQAIQIDPTCARCYMRIATTWVMRKDNTKALTFINQGIEIDPQSAELYSTRAWLKQNLKDHVGALRDLDKAIELEPLIPGYYIARGKYNADQGFFNLALKDYDKAIEVDPKHYFTFNSRAELYYNNRRYDLALKDLNSAILLDSSRSELYTSRGVVYAQLNGRNLAMADYRKALQLNPKDYLPAYNLAMELYVQENMDSSCSYLLQSYEILLKTDSRNPDIKEIETRFFDICDSSRASYYYQRGVASYNQKQFKRALTWYNKGLTKFPANPLTLQFRGNAFFLLGDYAHALPDYYAALNKKQDLLKELQNNPRYKNSTADSMTVFIKGFQASTYISIAETEFALGNYDQALKVINTGLELLPELNAFRKDAFLNVRGEIFLGMNKYDLALADFDLCIILNPNMALYYSNRAVARLCLADNSKLRQISISAELNNQSFRANWSIPITSVLKHGDAQLAAATADCSKALQLDPNSAYGYYVRGHIHKFLSLPDYCKDIIKANNLGYPVEPDLILECGK